MFIFTSEHLEQFFYDIIVYTARDIKINDFEYKSKTELLKDIASKDSKAMQLLEQFITAYREWYDYNFDRDGNGLSDFPDKKMASVLQMNRDSTRQELLDYIRK